MPAWPTDDARAVLLRVREIGARIGRRRIGPWALGGAVAGIAVALVARAGGVPFLQTAALVTFTVISAIALGTWRTVRALTPLATAREFERTFHDCDNLVVTTVELASADARPSGLAPAVAREALARLDRFDVATVDDGKRWMAATGAAIVLALTLASWPLTLDPPGASGVDAAGEAPRGIDLLRVDVTPPPHLGLEPTVVENPASVEAPEGSRLGLRVTSLAPRVELVEAGGVTRPLAGPAPAWRSPALTAPAGTVWTVRALTEDGRVIDERLLPLRIVEDRVPRVRVTEPAADQVLPDADARVRVELEAADDHGLARLALRYTRVTGSGETFTFTEGELPVAIERRSGREWRGTASLDLAALGLEMGDTLVYRAAARDGRPGATDTLSESFLIEIGGVGGAAGGGFTLPEDEHRHAISQQMLIVKTEALHGARAKLGAEAFLEESHHLAAEQRMVRAEFVFMTGGHVHDEVEEAEASHELAEGRFENEAMAEMLAATSHMSRAERLLIDGNTAEALVAERLALGALQRAFDRRRYFLRTTPERSRIELDRRLTGASDEARPWRRDATVPDAAPAELAAIVAALGRVDEAVAAPDRPLTDVARAIAALDPGAADVQAVVVRLATAEREGGRAEALAAAADALRARAAKWLAPAGQPPDAGDPALGALGDALARRRP